MNNKPLPGFWKSKRNMQIGGFMSLLILIFAISGIQDTYGQIVTYKAPLPDLLTADYTVRVKQKGKDWKTIPVYKASVVDRINGKRGAAQTSFCYFDFEGEVAVSVTAARKVDSVRIRPAGISVEAGKEMTFNLIRPAKLSLEINGDVTHNLQIFAGRPEKQIPDKGNKNVIYYGPGYHRVGYLRLKSGQTVYLDGGAVVEGCFIMKQVHDVKILGRGIVYKAPAPFEIENSKNIEVNGPIMLNPAHNTSTIAESENIKLTNIKTFSSQGWGDGIDVFCSKDVHIEDVFMRTSDDCIAIYGHRNKYYGNVENITVENSVLWADVAHPIMIGTHGDPEHRDTLSNMLFKNIDILEQDEDQVDYQGCMAINAGDDNLVKNVVFENIRVDGVRKGQLINLRIMYNKKYNTAPGKGIENIHFKNIFYSGPKPNLSILTGYNEDRKIKNVLFENLNINGIRITDDMPSKPGYYKTADMANMFIGEHVEEITFK